MTYRDDLFQAHRRIQDLEGELAAERALILGLVAAVQWIIKGKS